MAVSRKTNSAQAGVNLDRLVKLAERYETKQAKVAELRGDVGSVIKEVEDLGFNKAAFKLAVKLRNMEPEKRQDFLSSLNAYCDKLGVWAQSELFDDAAQGVGPENGKGDAEIPPREAGKKAGFKGEPIANNPHDPDTSDHDEWDRGWTDGQAARVGATIKPTHEAAHA